MSSDTVRLFNGNDSWSFSHPCICETGFVCLRHLYSHIFFRLSHVEIHLYQGENALIYRYNKNESGNLQLLPRNRLKNFLYVSEEFHLTYRYQELNL